MMKALSLTLILAAGLPLVRAQPTDALTQRLQSLGTLIENSSAARQIESSGVAAARERRDNARLMQLEAGAALRAGDQAAAQRLLDQAAREMMAGARLARPDQVAGDKARRDYEARLESARALLAAQQRITAEKSAGPEARQATADIEARLLQAEKLAGQGDHERARPLLDGAYLQARVSIESMRRGDTLVRSLRFESPAEEYAYEIDRNDTHRMLIQVVQGDRPDAAPRMRDFVERAAILRREAEARAAAGDHKTAIGQLEASTRELVRAIRAGGLYIPG
jgi:hypothetical protein